MEALELYERVQKLRKTRGIKSNYLLCQLAGISQSTITNWKQRKRFPSIPVLEAICDVLNVPLIQLFSDDTEEGLSEEKKRVLQLWDLLDSKQRHISVEVLEAFAMKPPGK